EIDKRNEERVRTLLEAAAAGKSNDPDAQKLGDLYATCMDEEKAESASPAALQLKLKRVSAVRDLPGLAREIARQHAEGARAFFEFESQQDAKDATEVIGWAHQGGLGLPDRDYYTREDEKSQALRKLYVEHVARMLTLAGTPADAAA